MRKPRMTKTAAGVMIVTILSGLTAGCGGGSSSASSTPTSATTLPNATTVPVVDVLGWFKEHRDDYRKLAAAVSDVHDISPAQQDFTVCKEIFPAVGDIELDLPTGKPALDRALRGGVAQLRNAAVSCASVLADHAAGNYAAEDKDFRNLLKQLHGMQRIQDALAAAGVPSDVL